MTRGKRETRLLVQGDGRQSGAHGGTPSGCVSCRGGVVRREVGRIEVGLTLCSSRYARALLARQVLFSNFRSRLIKNRSNHFQGLEF